MTARRIVLAAGLLLGAAGAQERGRRAPAGASDEVTRLVATLCSPDNPQDRYDAYRKLLTLRAREAVPLLVKSLPDASLYGQSLGHSLINSYPREVSVPAMRTLLGCKSNYLVAAAAAFLWRTEDKSVAPRIAEAITRATSQDELGQLLGALYAIRDDRVSAAVRALVTPGRGAYVLDQALHFLLTAEDAAARGAVTTLLASPGLSADERALLCAFLLALGDAGASAGFVKAVEAASPAGLQRLPRLLERAPRLDDAAKSALVRLLESAQGSAQQAAVARILARHPTGKATAVLERLLDSADPQTAQAVLDALLACGGIERDQLVALLSRPPQVAVRVADQLRRMDDLRGLPRVIAAAREPGPHRSEALRVLGQFHHKDAVPPLLAALEETEEALRSAAFQSLQTLLPDLFPFRRFHLAGCYSPSAPEGERRDGVQKIQAWWQAQGAGLK